MTDAGELKPCRCEPVVFRDPKYLGQLFRVRCHKCGRQTDTFKTEAEAIAAWNTRA